MWYIDTDNVIRIKNLQNVETSSYVNNAVITAVLYKLPESNPDVAAAVDNAGTVGIPVTAHGIEALKGFRIENSLNYDGDYIVELGSTVNQILITASFVAETFTGNEKLYEGVYGTKSNPITFTYVTDSNGDYVGKIPKTVGLVQGTYYMLCIWEVAGTEQVLSKVVEEAGYQGL
jgi:hypothetical protein